MDECLVWDDGHPLLKVTLRKPESRMLPPSPVTQDRAPRRLLLEVKIWEIFKIWMFPWSLVMPRGISRPSSRKGKLRRVVEIPVLPSGLWRWDAEYWVNSR